MFQSSTGIFVKISLALAVSLGAWLVATDEPALPPAKDGLPAKSPGGAESEAGNVNLLPNGEFESGDGSPADWQSIDGLSSFWVDDDDPQRGKVMKFDTDVLQSQAYKWWEQIVAGAKAVDAPPKLPTVEPKYDTLAGLDGVWFYSDYVPVERNKAYWLTLDVKGPEIMVWLIGYPEKPDTTFGADQGALQQFLQESKGTAEPQKRGRRAFIHKYTWKGQMKAGGSNEWKTYSRREMPFEPTKNTPNVRYVRVLVYPYWPPGLYYVDSVKLVEYRKP